MYQLLCQGQNIHTSAVLSDSNELLFDPMSIQLLRVGEESGSLTSMLNYLANFHEKKLDEHLSILMETLEPMLVIIMGLIVGTMVIALYLPLFQLGQIV
jgi:type II secretory pathway component PulF